MKRILIAGSVMLAGFMFAGCQATQPVAAPGNQKTVSQNQEPGNPAASPTVAPATNEEKEVNAIENEVNALDPETDFATFTDADLQ